MINIVKPQANFLIKECDLCLSFNRYPGTSTVSCKFDFIVYSLAHKLPKLNLASPHTFIAVLVLVS